MTASDNQSIASENTLSPKPESPTPSAQSPASILLIDVIGELGHWWGTASIGFVGGSLNDRGGQNMIEPAAYGVATCFGPNTRNFRDIVALLLAADAAAVVPDGAGLTAFVRRCLAESEWARELGTRAAAFAKTQQGATARTLRHLEAFLPKKP